jgi:hypothetical protein
MFWNNIRGTIEYYWKRRRLSPEERIKFDRFNHLDTTITFEKLKNDRNLFIDFFYSTPEEAVEELHRRNKKKISTQTHFKFRGIIHRDITPNIEINRMIGICDSLDLEPIFFDNPTDKFSCLSRSKYRLAKLAFIAGYNKNQELIYNYKKIIDFTKVEGKPLNKIKTLDGVNLIEYHKKWFAEIYPSLISKIHDVSKLVFFNKAKFIYKKIFKLAISDCVLIENFLLTGEEKIFTEKITFSNFLQQWRVTKLKPIVVPSDLLDMEGEDEYWLSYVNNKK